MNNLKIMLVIAAMTFSGCTMETMEDEESISEVEQELTDTNSLTSNALTSNALTSNALTSNALTSNSLAPSVLSAITDPGTVGYRARAFLRYAVGCAFSTSQTFSFTWTDDDDDDGTTYYETYRGELGLAPTWQTGPLDEKGQRMVTACIAARVNFYGMSVSISLRSIQDPLKTLTGSQELADYPNVEGAFWGNLWDSSPYINSCYNTTTVNNSRSWMRDCAAGHLNADGSMTACGIIRIVGPCSSACQALNSAGQYYPSCLERPGSSGNTTKMIVTTALP